MELPVTLLKATDGNRFQTMNKATAGATKEFAYPEPKTGPFQLYSLATPNGHKVGILLEELGIPNAHVHRIHDLSRGHAEDLKRQLLVAEQAQENHAIQEDLKKLSLYKEQSALLQQSESRATQQLSFYKEKFDSFDEAITESNKTFTTLRTNLDSSGKIIKRLEAENRLVKEKETATSKQNSKLSDLCKALQKQRSKLVKETAVLKAKVVQLEKQIEN